MGIALTAFAGLRAGFFRTVMGIIGLLLGLYLAPRIGPMIGDRLGFLGSETIASVAGYIIVLIAVETLASILGNILHGMAKALFLGWADHAAGAAVGVLQGLFYGLAIIAVLAMVAFRVPGNPAPSIESALVGSALVPYYLSFRSALPGRAQAFIPGEFAQSFDALEHQRRGVPR